MRDESDVRLSAAHNIVHVSRGACGRFLNQRRSAIAPFVQLIAGIGLIVRTGKRIQNLRDGPMAIIIIQSNHVKKPF